MWAVYCYCKTDQAGAFKHLQPLVLKMSITKTNAYENDPDKKKTYMEKNSADVFLRWKRRIFLSVFHQLSNKAEKTVQIREERSLWLTRKKKKILTCSSGLP